MSILQEMTAVRESAGIWARRTHTILQFTGADAITWLHNQTTNTVAGLRSGEGNLQALLDRTGRVQCFFSLHRFEEEAWILIERAQVPQLMQRLETHLFLEAVQVQDVGEGALQMCVEGPRALVFLKRLLEQPAEWPQKLHSFAPMRLLGFDVLVLRESETGEDGYLLVPAPGEADAFYSALLDHAAEHRIPEVGESALLTLRIESGLPRYGDDIDSTVVINETPLEPLAVSYDKGCYLGQEIVARLKTYGAPKHALVGLRVQDDGSQLPPAGSALYVDTQKVGEIRSSTYSPMLREWLAIAYLDRDHRTPEMLLRLRGESGDSFEAHVAHLPFVSPLPRRAYAEKLYHEALDLFEADVHDEDDTAILLLEDVIALAPEYEDAYEVLGVILHRHSRVEEAIEWMQRLAALNPNSIMAHTNLSVFYVSKGMIAEAEAEKAIAAQLEMRHDLDAKQAQLAAQRERQRIRQEAEERISMFREVLEIDPEDAVATMGLGSSYMQLEQYEEALPFFETATRIKKDYSAAYLNLGKCYEFLGRIAEACDAYKRGIEAASRKGDMMPLREMERRLRAIEA